MNKDHATIGCDKTRHISGLALSLIVVLASCASCIGVQTSPLLSSEVTRDMLLAGEPVFRDTPMPALPDAGILDMNEDMIRYLENRVDPGKHPSIVLRQLIDALMSDTSFEINYNEVTRTAAETFATRSGNCLAFTNLFVAMARHVGLNARYQVVDVPSSWVRHGETLVLNRHINVLVSTASPLATVGSTRQVVDFNISEFKSNYQQEIISDDQARAHYYSNIAVERLQEGDLQDSFLNLRRGLEFDEEYGVLWSNLGTLYTRLGQLDYAEASYLTALDYDYLNLTSMSNLVRVYDRAGESGRADEYRLRVAAFRARNPYYRFFEAQEQYRVNDFDAAIKNLRYAIRAEPEEDLFYYHLGLVYLHKGEYQLGQHYLEEARDIAVDDSVKQRYGHKIERLLEARTLAGANN